MYNTQSRGSLIPDCCKTGRKITETPYAVGLAAAEKMKLTALLSLVLESQARAAGTKREKA